MNDWYSWLLMFRQREAEALARGRQARIPRWTDGRPGAPALASLRLLVGGALIRLGEAVGGDRPAARACPHG